MVALSEALIVAGLAGFLRGFAAFGTAMVYVPLITLAYDVKTAVVTLFLVDVVPALPLIWKAAPQCNRRTVSWMAAGAIALTPVGAAFLLVADRAHSQLVLGVILLAAVSFMFFAQGFRIQATPAKSVAAGAISGFAGGVCGIFGPPAMIYLLGASADSRSLRADTIVYLTGEAFVLGITYLFYGMYTRWYLELSLLLLPVYGLCAWYGASRFSRTSETLYRRIILGLLWLVSVLLVIKSIILLSQ